MKINSMSIIRQSIVSVFLFASASTASALDLTEALELAQQHDTTYQVAYARYLAAIESSSQSTAAILPQIGFNAFIQRGRTEIDKAGSPVVNSDNNRDGYSINLNQVIFDKALFDNLKAGDANAAKALADLKAAKQETIIRVATAYFDILTAIETLDTAHAERKAISKQLEQSRERFNVGLTAITDVKEHQASYDISIADEIIAINNLSNKREALRVIINRYPENLKIARKNIPLVMPEPMDINAWQEKALLANFALISTEYAVDAARAAYNSSKGGHYPRLSLSASYGLTQSDERDIGFAQPIPGSDNTDAQVTLSLDIPIFSGGLTSSKIRQKLAELNQAKALHEHQRRLTIALARSTYLNLEADIAQVNARKQAVISTQTSLDATLAGYHAGTRTSVDVLLSQRQLFSSQREYAVARYAYITNSLKLKQVAGILTFDDIIKVNAWLIPVTDTSASANQNI